MEILTEEQILIIGRRKAIKHLTIDALLTFVIPIGIALINISLTSGIDSISFSAFSTAIKETWTIVQIVTAAVALTLTAYKIGPWTARQISIRPKSSFFIGFLTFLVFWTVFFMTYVTIDGIRRAEKFGNSLLNSIFNGWLPMTIILFIIIAIPTSILFGYFLGRNIKIALNEK